MLAAALHPFRGHGPGPRSEIDLGPRRETHFAGPCRSEHDELERARRRTLLAAKRLHEVGHLRDGKRRMVLRLRHLGGCRQLGVEMSTPPSRIETLPLPA